MISSRVCMRCLASKGSREKPRRRPRSVSGLPKTEDDGNALEPLTTSEVSCAVLADPCWRGLIAVSCPVSPTIQQTMKLEHLRFGVPENFLSTPSRDRNLLPSLADRSERFAVIHPK